MNSCPESQSGLRCLGAFVGPLCNSERMGRAHAQSFEMTAHTLACLGLRFRYKI